MSNSSRNRLLGRLRLLALYAVVAAAVIAARPSPPGLVIGFAILVLGEAIRLWAAGHLVKTRQLIVSGPYLYTRNPLYLGRLLIFTGLCVMARLPYFANFVLLAVGYGVFFGYYLPRKEQVEPDRLRQAHGEAYQRYFDAVPALLPSMTAYDAGRGDGWSSQRMLRNREHWMVTALLAISLFLLWRTYGG